MGNKLISPDDIRKLESIAAENPSSIIAGGFVRDTELGVGFKDIDVYIPGASSRLTQRKLDKLGAYRTSGDYSGSNIYTYQIKDSDINLVVVKDARNQEDLHNYVRRTFDVGLCMCWINLNDGSTYLTPEFIEDRDHKTLTIYYSNIYAESFGPCIRLPTMIFDKDPGVLLRVLDEHVPRLLKKYPDYGVRINYDIT